MFFDVKILITLDLREQYKTKQKKQKQRQFMTPLNLGQLNIQAIWNHSSTRRRKKREHDSADVWFPTRVSL